MVRVFFFLVNAHFRPVFSVSKGVDVPDTASIARLEDKIFEYLSQTHVKPFYGAEIWRCTDSAPELPEDDMQALERILKDTSSAGQLCKLLPRTKIRDLHLRENESLIVKVSVARRIYYITVDHEMRPTSTDIFSWTARDVSDLINDDPKLKDKSHQDKLIVWRSTAKKLSTNAEFKTLTETITEVDFADPDQVTKLPRLTLATDIDADEVLIVQVLAGDADEARDTLMPLHTVMDLNKDFEHTYSGIRFLQSPSTNSRSTEYSKNQSTNRNIIYDGLCAPSESAPNTSAPPIHIYHPVFAQFTRGANDPSANPDPDFLKLVRKCMANACNVGYNEETSDESMWRQLTDILQYSVESHDDDSTTNSAIMFNHPKVQTPMVVAELKSSLGGDGCDPSIQAGNSMRKLLGQDKAKLIVEKCCCPVFILAGGGPWLCVLGGVFVNRFIVQRLTDMMWIGFATTHEDHRVYHIAKVLLALKNSLQDLKRFYAFVVSTNKIPDFNVKASVPHPRHFPYPHSYIDGQGTLVIFEYLGLLQADMRCVTFLAKIKRTGEAIVVKFADKYGAEVHQFLAEQGHAPQLLYYGALPDRTIYYASETTPGHMKSMNAGYHRSGPAIAPEMKMVVMEYISQFEARLDNLILSHEKISDVLKSLHANGYVFGDLRGPNIMFDVKENVKFIDFDWAGRYDIRDYLSLDQQEYAKKTWARLGNVGGITAEEQVTFATYPVGISFAISWAEGVDACAPILPDHDDEMLEKLYSCWLMGG